MTGPCSFSGTVSMRAVLRIILKWPVWEGQAGPATASWTPRAWLRWPRVAARQCGLPGWVHPYSGWVFQTGVPPSCPSPNILLGSTHSERERRGRVRSCIAMPVECWAFAALALVLRGGSGYCSFSSPAPPRPRGALPEQGGRLRKRELSSLASQQCHGAPGAQGLGTKHRLKSGSEARGRLVRLGIRQRPRHRANKPFLAAAHLWRIRRIRPPAGRATRRCFMQVWKLPRPGSPRGSLVVEGPFVAFFRLTFLGPAKCHVGFTARPHGREFSISTTPSPCHVGRREQR